MDRSNRDSEYVIVSDRKPKATARYYYDDEEDDDDNESQIATSSRRIVREKPAKERIKYVAVNNAESDYRRQRRTESNDDRIKIRRTKDGEQIVLDEDDNILKIIRNTRSPTPPPSHDTRRPKVRPAEPRVVYYETSDGRIVARRPKHHSLVKKKMEYILSEDEPTKVVRKIVIDPRNSEPDVVYEKPRSKKYPKEKIIVRRPINETPADSDDEYEQREQPEYVQVVHRRPARTQVIEKKEPSTKYVMIRKKVEPEPVENATPPVPAAKPTRRVVYKVAKKPTTKYVYAADEKD